MWTRLFVIVCILWSVSCLVPKPENQIIGEEDYALGEGLEVQHNYTDCPILDDAWKRFTNRLLGRQLPVEGENPPVARIKYVNIDIQSGCSETKSLLWPRNGANESCRFKVFFVMYHEDSVKISKEAIYINAEEIWGTLYALETVAQLLRRTHNGQVCFVCANLIIIKSQDIIDKPKFPHRGFLIDSSRHFLPVTNILQFLDAMAMVKMNVLHWHIVDDQSFPFVSCKFPNLSAKGSYDPVHYVYSRDDVSRILDYARRRGIRVMPEFDTPGHTYSWGEGDRKLLTPCYSEGVPDGTYGPMNPAESYTYEFLVDLFEEVTKVFPEQMFHLGGDEVPYDCWASNPGVQEVMIHLGFGKDYRRLQTYYTEQVINLVHKITEGHKTVVPVVWQEVFDQGLRTHKDTIIQVWKDGWKAEMNNVTAAGYSVLLSSCWYLDYISYGSDWYKYYDCDPTDFGGSPKQIARVQGGEACLWGEHVDETNLFSRAWPRGVPVAERLWSTGTLSKGEFAHRLDDLRCQMVKMWIRCFITTCVLCSVNCLVPKPERQTLGEETYAVDDRIDVQHSYPDCLILDDAWERFSGRLLDRQLPVDEESHPVATIKHVKITMLSGCNEKKKVLWPTSGANESYAVCISNDTISIKSEEIWGTLHALETVAQLIRRNQDGLRVIRGQVISDKPRFGFRGFLIDTSRHYLPLLTIFQFLDAMAMVKMNVLHWHVVDDQSFPFVSHRFPSLSGKGSFDPVHYVYSRDDVNQILDYARRRGIRVMPEFDTPGHTKSWGLGYPKLLTPCYSGGSPDGQRGPIHPAQLYSYKFLIHLFEEISTVFPEQLVHLGGDEVPYDCWASNPDIQKFMEQMHFGKNYSLLQTYYMEQIISLIKKINQQKTAVVPVVWQEVFDQGLRTHNDTLIHVWKGDWQSEVKRITSAGFPVLVSSCWYLSRISYGVDWHQYYQCDPTDFGGNPEEVARIQGGEACMWGEYVDETNIFSRSWPRGVAVAERLWSHGKLSAVEFAGRLNDIRCQMVHRGWNAQPANGPGFCPI
ncbi:hypothetical protein T265_05296 [Opisthorchis viverrini]|uniref:beta-N-acetylhexosaminidase n=1 Tax=Opisthorchis viverrini TaxID=6198 RepID=A0A074ZPL5_OPIVI|nr:hypothetical protein T265_05296 [Opisthorchis viverrini]KER27742.1 hypothetical protein T265_05296 [Opisthorchis viverrini]